MIEEKVIIFKLNFNVTKKNRPFWIKTTEIFISKSRTIGPNPIKIIINCVGYFQNGLKPFSCYVKVSYAIKVID